MLKSQERYIPNYDFLLLENRITELSFIKNNFVVEHFVTQIFCNSYKSSKNISILEKTNYIFYHGPRLFSLPKLLKLLHLWSFCVVFLGPQWILVPWPRFEPVSYAPGSPCAYVFILRIWQYLFEVLRGLSWIWNGLHAFILQLRVASIFRKFHNKKTKVKNNKIP